MLSRGARPCRTPSRRRDDVSGAGGGLCVRPCLSAAFSRAARPPVRRVSAGRGFWLRTVEEDVLVLEARFARVFFDASWALASKELDAQKQLQSDKPPCEQCEALSVRSFNPGTRSCGSRRRGSVPVFRQRSSYSRRKRATAGDAASKRWMVSAEETRAAGGAIRASGPAATGGRGRGTGRGATAPATGRGAARAGTHAAWICHRRAAAAAATWTTFRGDRHALAGTRAPTTTAAASAATTPATTNAARTTPWTRQSRRPRRGAGADRFDVFRGSDGSRRLAGTWIAGTRIVRPNARSNARRRGSFRNAPPPRIARSDSAAVPPAERVAVAGRPAERVAAANRPVERVAAAAATLRKARRKTRDSEGAWSNTPRPRGGTPRGRRRCRGARPRRTWPSSARPRKSTI